MEEREVVLGPEVIAATNPDQHGVAAAFLGPLQRKISREDDIADMIQRQFSSRLPAIPPTSDARRSADDRAHLLGAYRHAACSGRSDGRLACDRCDARSALIASLPIRSRAIPRNGKLPSKQLFDDFCVREKLPILAGPAAGHEASASAQWHVETGNDARWVAVFGRCADLILAARGAEHDITNRSVLETALIETGRPLLIPAGNTPQSIIGGTVAIAWKARLQAARAVAAAMPFLVRATETVVMTVNAGDGDDNADRLVRNLAWHGVRATVDRLQADDQDPAEMLLSAAGRRAQLLVMGGYGHSRMREWIFGGFTQRVLGRCAAPGAARSLTVALRSPMRSRLSYSKARMVYRTAMASAG